MLIIYNETGDNLAFSHNRGIRLIFVVQMLAMLAHIFDIIYFQFHFPHACTPHFAHRQMSNTAAASNNRNVHEIIFTINVMEQL